MATGEVKKWLENAERGIAQGKPGYVLTSSSELKKLGKPDEAEAVLRKALEKLPAEIDKTKILASLCSIVMDANPAEVLDLVKMGGKKDPGLLLMEATALGKLDRNDKAIDRLKGEIDLDTDLAKNVFIATKLTTLYLQEGKSQEAVGFLEPLVNAGYFGGHLQIKQILADAYLKIGKADKALEVLGDLRDARSRELVMKAQGVLGGGPPLPPVGNPRVFVVHGHDRTSLSELKNLLYRIGAVPLAFDDFPTRGSQTVIELLEEHIPTFDALIALLTPDDEGRKRGETGWELRARENVLIEAGYGLISRRERSLIVALGGVSIPSDCEGIHRVAAKEWTAEVGMRVAKRLADMGLNVDVSKVA